ncbi:glycosyltransferase family 8 protein [Mannheimia haemolytica]|uniref:glycosyltransferase family 8 protein n=1 Tax=Mannheimia haemolytica TaxID=75985 RepID=UPI00201C9ECA|nr:glycosyltransferase family 8 protein [Mannheimia haemolytica]UQX79564.1 glycosyltransferase family 8 protein [Mannheimia haemolytica]
MKKYNIVFSADKNYLPYLEIALKSLLAHHNHLSIFILSTGDISHHWIETLRPYLENRYSTLRLGYLDSNNLANFNSNGYITNSTYLRYYIEELFEHSDSPYWIYLDCDLVVNGNITDPFTNLDFSFGSIAAIADPYVNKLKNHPYIYKNYFNAGVFYLNAKHFSKQPFIQLTERFKENLPFGDQDILNYCFQYNWIELDRKYNYQTEHLLDDIAQQKISPNYIPHIIHFTGGIKPLEGKFNSSTLKTLQVYFDFTTTQAGKY